MSKNDGKRQGFRGSYAEDFLREFFGKNAFVVSYHVREYKDLVGISITIWLRDPKDKAVHGKARLKFPNSGDLQPSEFIGDVKEALFLAIDDLLKQKKPKRGQNVKKTL